MTERKRVLICGSNYGASYLEALRSKPERYETVGLLAQGGMRSRRLAIENDLPLYRSLEAIPSSIDLACAALPTSAGNLVFGLLDRGIPVLCEHPRRPAFLLQAIRAAALSGTVFHLNAHFGDLAAGRAFIRKARLRRREAKPVYIEILATERSVYAALDLMARGIGMPGDVWRRDAGGAWTTLTGVIEGVETVMRLQTSPASAVTVLGDGSEEYLVDVRITCMFPQGLLTLLSVAGPVVWNANLSLALRKGLALWQSPMAAESSSGKNFHADRVRANLRAVRTIEREACRGSSVSWQRAEHLLGVSRSWEAVTGALGLHDSGSEL